MYNSARIRRSANFCNLFYSIRHLRFCRNSANLPRQLLRPNKRCFKFGVRFQNNLKIESVCGGDMYLKSNFFRVVSALCLALTMAIFAFADTIRLKDGSIIKGKIVSFDGGRFVVVVGDGTRQKQLNYAASEVESIQFDGGGSATFKSSNNPTEATKNNGNSTIITVGQKTAKTPETEKTPPAPLKTPTVTTTTQTVKPIEVGVKVLADNTANGWTNSGWVVKKGQKIKITGTGRVSLGGGRYTTPGGIASLPDKDKLLANEATGGLIAVIGDNNNDFIFIGESREFTATQDGALFLGVNEGNLNDNSGAFDIKIEISPEIGY